MLEFDFSTISAHERYNLVIGLVNPRPIALVTSMDTSGRVNAAPFSAYNYMCADPVLIVLGVANRPGEKTEAGAPVGKDTAQNIRARGEFVVNVVNEDIADAMNICCIDFPHEVSEIAEAKLTTTASTRISVPRITEAPAAMECREVGTFERGNSRIVIGEVLYVHIRDEFVDPAGPYVRADELHTIGRMNGAGNYVRTRDAFFKLPRPTLEDWQKSKAAR